MKQARRATGGARSFSMGKGAQIYHAGGARNDSRPPDEAGGAIR
jgi:hypothetical protein